MAYDISVLKEQVKKTEEWLSHELSVVRTGRATAALLDNIYIESYGAKMPISHVAGLLVEDAKTIRVTPWDKGQIKEVEKAVQSSNLGLSVSVDGEGVRIIFPDLTAERREALKKVVNEKLEEARVALRKHRDDIWNEVQKEEKKKNISEDEKFRLKEEMEKIVKEANERLLETIERKEKEISS